MKVNVEVFYRIEGKFGRVEDKDKALGTLAEELGGKWTAQGSGGGVADIEFTFGSKKAANQFRRSLKRLPWVSNVNTYIWKGKVLEAVVR